MNVSDKIKSVQELSDICRKAKSEGKRVVHCHGCFDLLHIGHIRYFSEARSMGDVVIVTISPDVYVDKGPHRPMFTETLRAEAVASLGTVDYVGLNQWPTAVETLKLLLPDIYVKGADFKSAAADPTGKLAEEERLCHSLGIEMRFTDDIVFSSTNIINRFFNSFSDEVQQYLELFRKRHSLDELLEPLERMSELKVLVVGDTIIDDYQYCHPLGASSKSPVLAMQYDSHDIFAGGVLAIANHVASFAGQTEVISVIGQSTPERDNYESFIRSRLKSNVAPYFFVQDGAPTLVKRRFLDGYSLTKLLEVYIMDDRGLSPSKLAGFDTTLAERCAECDLVIVGDFGHGAIAGSSRQVLVDRAPFLAVNTQANAGNQRLHTISRYDRADFVSLTENELRLDIRDCDTDLRLVTSQVAKRLNAAHVAVTRGKKGCCVGEPDGSFVAVPAFVSKVVDSVGAGDAFFSVAALAAKLGLSREFIGFYGNVVGSLAVQVIGNEKPVDLKAASKFITALLK